MMNKKFNVDSVRHLMKTEPNQALFWSGTTSFSKPEGMSDEEYASFAESFGGQKAAESYAQRTGRKTLEMKMEENKDALIAAGFPYDAEKGTFIYNDETKKDWEDISAAFAEGASGEVEVLYGMDENTLYGDIESGSVSEYESIWNRQEYKRLFGNNGVSKLTAVDPLSEEKEEVFARTKIDDIIPPQPPIDGKWDGDPPIPPTGSYTDNIPPNNGGGAIKPSAPPSGSASEEENGFQSAYADRIRQTPSLESNRWAGERGESICAPQSDAARQILEERGMSGVTYQNGVPDFSPFSESTVKLGYMTDARHSSGLVDGRDSKNTVYAHFEDGELVSSSHRADKGSMADLHMKYDKPGNFEQADALTAEQWTADGKDGREWTADDVAQYRKDNGLTWHECNDMETMQMVPEAINADFGHLGGVAEVKETQRIVDEVLSQENDGAWIEDEDFDRMSKEELESFNRENGHYDEDGIWIADDFSADRNNETATDKEPDAVLAEPIDDSGDITLSETLDDSGDITYAEPIDNSGDVTYAEPIDDSGDITYVEPIDDCGGITYAEPLDDGIDAALAGTTDDSQNEIGKEAVDNSNETEGNPIDEPVEELIDEPTEEPVEEPIDEPAEESVNEPIDEPAEEPVEEPIDEPAEEPVEEPIDKPAEEPVEEPIDEPAEEPVEEPIDEPAEEPVEEPIDEPAEEPVEEPIDEPVEEPIDEPAEEPIEDPIDEPAEEPVEEPIDEPAEEPVEEPIDEPAEEPVEEPIDEPAEEPIDDFSDVDESLESSEKTDDYTDLSDENDDIADEATDSFDDLSDEEVVDDYDSSEDFSDLSDDVNDDFVDDSDYSDYSDDVIDEPIDSSDYSDISDDVDSESYDDSALDSGDVSVDSGDSGSFDGGGDSID